MQMGARGPQYGIQLLLRSDVQADLKITDEQKTKIEAARPQRGQGRQGGGGGAPGAPGAGGGQPDAATMAARRAEQEKVVNDILTPDQQKRLKEIAIQLAGTQAIVSPEVQKDLGFTEDQKKKITDLQKTYQEASQSLREKMRNQELDRQQAMEAFTKNTDTLKAELAKILTPEQSEKLKTLGGAPFKADTQN